LILEYFNGSIPDAFHFFDDDRSGCIHKKEFVTKCRVIDYNGPAAHLFDLLDRDGFGNVYKSNMAFLETWQTEPYFFSSPDYGAVTLFKEALLEAFGSPLFKAWRKALDTDASMRLSWGEFAKACQSLARPGVPKTEAEMASVWRALDEDCSGFITICEFDASCSRVLKDFKHHVDKEFSSAVAAYRTADINRDDKITCVELHRLLHRSERFRNVEDVKALFDTLDVDGLRRIREQDIAFLDRWELAWEE